MNCAAGTFAARLLRWWDANGRKDLPWQVDRTPYRVWVSEIMLQQTQVAAAIPYFLRFTARFGDVHALARAPIDEVLHLWSGLGYYARARNLHAAAAIVSQHHGGQLPGSIAALLELPGIGRSTAAAILALSRGERHAILDGNVKRVLARHAGVDGWPGEAEVEKRLWALAEARTPADRAADYTQAIMDLGATLCTRARAACGRCPVAGDCRALAAGRVSELPAPRPRRVVPVRSTGFMVLLDDSGRALLERRPPAGIWGGLWSFPECAPDAAAARACATGMGFSVRACEALPPLRHTFTHFHLDIAPFAMQVDCAGGAAMDAPERLWYKAGEPVAIGLAAPVAALLHAATSAAAAPRAEGRKRR
ncbi:MAG: A/G-specific adenine glycosylase [Gammaproteobacteria bacterium]